MHAFLVELSELPMHAASTPDATEAVRRALNVVIDNWKKLNERDQNICIDSLLGAMHVVTSEAENRTFLNRKREIRIRI